MPKTNRPPREAPVVIRLAADQRAALVQIAAEDGVSLSELVRRLIATEIRSWRASSSRGSKPAAPAADTTDPASS